MRNEDIEDRLTKLEALVDLLIRQTKTTTVESKETFSALDFTGKQHAVIQMIYCGYSTRQMAETLDVSEGTIKVHISAIMNRTGIRNRTQIPALYEEWLDRLSGEQYERQSSLPFGWASDPSAHNMITKQLRVKTR